MNTGEENTPDAAAGTDVSPLLSLDLELAPAWARKSPEAHHRRYADDDRGGEEDRHPSGRDRDFRRDRRDGGRDGGRDRRAPRGGPAPDFRRERREGGRDRGPARRDDRREFRPVRAEPLPPLPLDIRVLPDQKALGAIIRKIQSTHRAYPLRDIARLFLDNDAAYQIRIEPAKGQAVPLFQCKVCGLPALSEEEVRAHVLSVHLEDFFDVSEIETDPPAGNFVCVARCGLSGELLGPPNHHSYSNRVQEMLRTRFAHMGADAYRARIEMVRDPEVVTQWKESCRRKKVYRRKRPPQPEVASPDAAEGAPTPAEGAPAPAAEEVPLGPALEKAAAELLFQREILPTQIAAVKHMVCPAGAVRRTPSQRLLETVRETMNRELRFPASLFFALRGAFRHRELHLFRAIQDRGPEFVVARAPTALDATHVVAELRQVLTYINEHPGCTRPELLAALAAGDETRGAHLATQLNTLVEKAHVIEFYNGVLSPPVEHPPFHYLPGERDGGQAPGAKRQASKDELPKAKEPAQAPAEPVASPVAEAQQEAPAPAPEPAAAAEAPVAESAVPAAEPAAPPATTE